jgi:hypothetical protein
MGLLVIATIFATIFTGIGTAPVIPTSRQTMAATAIEAALTNLQNFPAAQATAQEQAIVSLSEKDAKDIIRAALKQRVDEKTQLESEREHALRKDVKLFWTLLTIAVLTFGLAYGVHRVLS